MANVGVLFAPNDPALEANPTWVEMSNLSGVSVLSWEIDRGRPDELSQIGTGTGVVQLLDLDGILDPTNSGGTFFGKLNPSKQIAIVLRNPVDSSQGTVFRGHAEDWLVDVDITERWSTVTLNLVDAMDIFANSLLRPGEDGDPAPPGAEGQVFYEDGNVDDRILSALSSVGTTGWSSALSEVFSGNVTMPESIYAPDTAALAVIQDAADAEFPAVAGFWINRQGTATFHGRFARFNPDNALYHIAKWKVGDLAAFGADSNTAVISALTFGRSKASIVNSALITPQNVAGTSVPGLLREASSSIGTYGVRPFPSENLFVSGGQTVNVGDAVAVCGTYGQYYIDNLKTPHTRISSVSITSPPPSHPTAARVWTVLTQGDLSDIFRVTTTHSGGGGFVDENYFIESIHMEASSVGTSYHHVEAKYDVSPRANYGTATFGTA